VTYLHELRSLVCTLSRTLVSVAKTASSAAVAGLAIVGSVPLRVRAVRVGIRKKSLGNERSMVFERRGGSNATTGDAGQQTCGPALC